MEHNNPLISTTGDSPPVQSAEIPPAPTQPTTISVPPVPPTLTKKSFVQMASIIFIILAFVYVGITFWNSASISNSPHDKAKAKALYEQVENKEIIKKKKSLSLLHEQEGILKDKRAVYRCDLIDTIYKNCVVQEKIIDPESFVRITNIYGQDSKAVYILDGDSNRYKVFTKPEYKTFRSYFVENESHHGLYSWDDYQVFKGEKVIRGSATTTLSTSTPALKPNYNVFRSTFFKQYRDNEIVAPRNPYLGIIDSNIQFASDGKYIYHGDGRSTAGSDSIYVFKVNEADLATFEPYGQQMVGTSYLKYATDKSRIFCDNVRIDEEGYPVSEGLSIIVDPTPKSFQVIYPTGAITEKNADLQVAKTDTQVFVNCTPQPQIDAATFKASTAQKVFTDRNNTYYLTLIASGTIQVAALSITSPKVVNSQEAESQDPGYFMHTDTKNNLSIELPNHFSVKENRTSVESVLFAASGKSLISNNTINMVLSKEKTSLSEKELLSNSASSLLWSGVGKKTYIFTNDNKEIRIAESKVFNKSKQKEENVMHALYLRSGYIFVVTVGVAPEDWEANKEIMTRIVTSLVFK